LTGAGGKTGTGGAAGATTAPALDASVMDSGAGGVSSAGGIAAAGGSVGTGGSATGGNVDGASSVDGGIDVAPDAPARNFDTGLADLPSSFHMGGVWLVGWGGDLGHYSWVRISAKTGGTAEYLSGTDIPRNIPFWACDGQGSWFPTEAPYSIMLEFPSACPSNLPSFFTFRNAVDPTTYPPGATFGMVAAGISTVQPQSEWWLFPDDQCDAKMSACKSPF
jgi:hypothetical protein